MSSDLFGLIDVLQLHVLKTRVTTTKLYQKKNPKQQHRHQTNNKISFHLILPSCFTQIHANLSGFSNHEKFKTLRNQPFEIMSFISYFKQKKSIASGRIQLETLNLFYH